MPTLKEREGSMGVWEYLLSTVVGGWKYNMGGVGVWEGGVEHGRGRELARVLITRY